MKRAEKAMGGKKKSSGYGKKVHEMSLRRAASGELIAKHKHMPTPDEPTPQDEDHVVPEGGMQDHIDQHMPMPQQESTAPSPAIPGL